MEVGEKRKTINGESQAKREQRLGLNRAKTLMSPAERKAHDEVVKYTTGGERHRVGRAPTLDQLDGDVS